MKIAVLGGGTMGNGIAQIAATVGHDVRLRDIDTPALERAESAIATSLARMVKSERLTAEAADETRGRIHLTTELIEASQDADVVIEAVPEVLDIKQEILGEALRHAADDALIGTNTSQLSITAIGAALGTAAPRLIGMHFFNPPVMMRLVELIRGLHTSDDTVERAREFATGLGKQVVVCQKDSPGFLTSRVSAILRMEALHMLEEGLASAEDIDTAIKLAFNHPMGPLELGDFNGLDTYLSALNGLNTAHGDRFRPTVGLRNMVSAGNLGRKSGRGFYEYDANGKRVENPT